jgi:hypothetical protein
VPQGGPLSPLLANIALDPLDKELESRGHKFARYADDFIVLVKSANAAKRVLAALIRYTEGRLQLIVNRAKSRAAPLKQCAFLSQNEIVRYALNNRWLEEQGVPDMNAMAAVAAQKKPRSHPAWTDAAESKPSGSFFTTGQRPQADWNRPVRSHTQGGVGPGS